MSDEQNTFVGSVFGEFEQDYRMAESENVAQAQDTDNDNIRHAMRVLSAPGVVVSFLTTPYTDETRPEPGAPVEIRVEAPAKDWTSRVASRTFDPEISRREYGDSPAEALCAAFVGLASCLSLNLTTEMKEYLS